MTSTGKQDTAGGPMTLHAVMRDSVGMGLRERYKAEQEIPHGLLVLLMQMNHHRVRGKQLRAEEGLSGTPA
jgi:hypothetical protein